MESGAAAASRERDCGWRLTGEQGKWHRVRRNSSSDAEQCKRRRKNGFSHEITFDLWRAPI
jgi:hypothetical protein